MARGAVWKVFVLTLIGNMDYVREQESTYLSGTWTPFHNQEKSLEPPAKRKKASRCSGKENVATENPIKHAHTSSLTTAENLSKSSSTILAWDHVRDHAHFRHGTFFRAFDQVASHTAVKGVVAALETAPEASQPL